MADQWLSIVEYARQFNMSDMTVRRRIKTGKINAVLRDGKYFIPASEAIRKMTQSGNSASISHAHATSHSAPIASQQRTTNTQLMKPRPHVDNHFAQQAPTHHAVTSQRTAPPYFNPTSNQDNDSTDHQIPHSLRQHTTASPSAMVDTNTLLAFCDATLRKTNEAEQRLDQYYKELVARLQADVNQRDQQIKHLAQQVEDLQLLTKILERKIRTP